MLIVVALVIVSYFVDASKCLETKWTIDDAINHTNWPRDTQEDCGLSYADRIIGGVNATLGQYPWLARIGYKKHNNISYNCGGTLISKQFVLTAAHCVTNLEPRVRIVSIILGEHNSLTEIDCQDDFCADPVQELRPQQIILPANYNNPPFKHDIALIKLNGWVNITEWVTPVCLPFGNILKANLSKEVGEVAGWGLTDSDDEVGTPFLQTVKLPILDLYVCNVIYGSALDIGNEQLCVGGLIGKDSCSGDSGGPLVKAMNSELGARHFIFGIVSFGSKRCGETPTPGVYTNINYYMKWILDNLNSS